jgi:hypothetical protein
LQQIEALNSELAKVNAQRSIDHEHVQERLALLQRHNKVCGPEVLQG